MKVILSLLLFFLFSVIAFSQPGEGFGNRMGTIYGKVLEPNTGKGLASASVQLFIPASLNNGKDSIIAGMFTRSNGDFIFENVQRADSFLLLVTAIGFKSIEKNISFDMYGSFSPELDLGNFELDADEKVLQNVTVVATKQALELGIDRRVFNVDKAITATGGTAIDVMKNIPAVSVDVDGNVSVRNSSPQIFVDGRPTILTLDQIPADNIDKIEVITNPSAKFDAASSGGIINVVLKKNKTLGLNGNVSAGIGHPDILNGNLSLNLREGKFNFFVSGSYNQSGGKAKGETYRTNFKNGLVDNYFNQFSQNDRMRRFRSLRFGLDFFMDNRNTLSLSQGIVSGRFANEESQQQEYFLSNGSLQKTGERYSDSRFSFDRNNTQAVFTHKFAPPGKQITADINYSYGGAGNDALINNSFSNPDGTPFSATNRVRNDGSNNNNQLTAQLDFVDPKGENSKIETGLRTNINNYSSVFNAFALGAAGGETKLPLSNRYKYKEIVHAGYFTFSNKIKSFTYQVGLRAEISKFDGEIIDSSQKFGYSFPDKLKNIWDALFPSAFITKALSENEDLQVNYSRRIRRPNFWHINPFIDINDPVNLRQGNPRLKPEFTNSFEVNYNKNYKAGNFLAVIYYRNQLGDITRFSDTISEAVYQQLNNAAVDPNAILNTFINAKSTNRLGAEFTLQQKFANGFDITPSIDLQYRQVNTNPEQASLSNEGFNWEGKLIVNYKVSSKTKGIFKNMSFQTIGEYESPEIVPQGKRKEQYSIDFAIRKDLFDKNKGTITFSINDVLNSQRYGSIYDTENFYQDSYRRRNVRSFRFTFSYRFGDTNFSLFKRRDRSRGNEMDMEGSDL